MRSGYFDVSWFLRAARVLPVIAGAALLGGVIGGFAVFAIDSALTWEPLTREPVSQPRPDARADSQTSAVVAQTKPVRIVGGAIPDPSAGMSHYRVHIRTPRMRQMQTACSSKPRHLLAAIAPPAPTIRIAPTHSATAVMADATGAGKMMPGRLHRAGRTRGVTIVFMIPTAIAGTARTAMRANNLTATPEEIRMTPLRGPTCRAPRCGAPTCSASGATRAIKTDRSLKTTIAIRRPRQIARGPSRSGAVAAFSAAAMRIRTTTKAK